MNWKLCHAVQWIMKFYDYLIFNEATTRRMIVILCDS